MTDAVFDFGVVIWAKEILLLPLVGFFADVKDLHDDDMPPLGPPPVRVLAVQELRLGPEMVLSQRFGISDE